ncbi:MAG: 50S ribosomal protein L17 [Lachnospiraceae bacterium]|nr:50S ribosomal protein L17 [Lachnospiraceae bacterium]
MAKYRKLGRTASQRKALLRSQVTALILNGKIKTTEAKAEEVQKMAEKVITLAAHEMDNFETVTIKAKEPVRDKDGHRVKQIVDKNDKEKVLSESIRDESGKLLHIENGVTVTKYNIVDKEIKKDLPSRLHARRQMLKVLYPVTENPTGKKKDMKKVDLPAKLFDEIAPKYKDRKGGYTRIVKIGLRKGDNAMEVLLELV